MTLPSSGIETIGQRLKQARQQRGLSIEEAAQATRIRVNYLQALEEDNFAALPSAVQGRGFLRSYASYLGVITPLPVQQQTTAPAPLTAVIPPPTSPSKPLEPIKSPEQPETPVDQPVSKKSLFRRRRAPKDPTLIEGGDQKSSNTSQAIFREVGQILRQRRDALGLSLTEIEQYTRLRLHYLKALENGEVNNLPSPVQGRGMLNNYALFLNLDADALLLKYADGLQARRIEHLGPRAPHRAEARTVTYPALRRILSLDMIIGVLLVLTMVVFLIWGISQVTSQQNCPVTAPTLPPVSEILAETASPTGSIESSTTPQTATPSPLGTGPSTLAGTLVFTPAPDSTAPIQVYVVARYQAWLRVTVDGKIVFTGRVLPGNAYPFAGAQQVELLTGNAAALQVFYNQTDVGSLGLVGQVVNLVFTDTGMVMPTAAPTPTITKTIPVSPTPAISGTPQVSPSPTPTK
jgi:cytoskeleton protein RodZ